MKSLLAILTITTISLAALTGCASGEVKETKADGSAIVKPEGTIALYSTPKISTIPTWTINKLPEGWSQDELVIDTTDPRYNEESFKKVLAEELKYNPLMIYNEDKSCYVRPSTTFIPSNNSGRGDLYLSKKSFYDEADIGWYGTSAEGIVTIPTNSKGKLELYSGVIDHLPSIFGGSETGKDVQTWFAYRAIDQKFLNPNPPKAVDKPVLSQEQIDSGMTIIDDVKTPDRVNVLPVYTVEMSCKTSSAFNKVDMQTILDSLEINLQ